MQNLKPLNYNLQIIYTKKFINKNLENFEFQIQKTLIIHYFSSFLLIYILSILSMNNTNSNLSTKNTSNLLYLNKIIRQYIPVPKSKKPNPPFIHQLHFIKSNQLKNYKSPSINTHQQHNHHPHLSLSHSILKFRKKKTISIQQPNLAKPKQSLIKYYSTQSGPQSINTIRLMHNPSYFQIKQKVINRLRIKNRYEILQILAKSKQSIVYKVNDNLSNKIFAIKILTQRIGHQLQILKQLDHQNLVKNINVFIYQNKLHLVFDYYQKSLSQYLKQIKHDPAQIKQIFKQICKGVQYLHRFDIIHRNLKISNIMIKQNPPSFHQPKKITPKIMDFALALKLDQDQKSIFSFKDFCGTPDHIPPEMIQKYSYEGKPVDCWALGIMLYSMLVGRCPFKAKQQSQLYRKIKKGKIYFPLDIPDGAKKLILNILNRDPLERYTINQILGDSWLVF